MNDCIFCKIIKRNIPANIIYEDNELIAFNDIYPKAEVHFLVIPKTHIISMLHLNHAHEQIIGKLMIVANQIARELGLDKGYRLQINTGERGGQEVPHLHIHILGDK